MGDYEDEANYNEEYGNDEFGYGSELLEKGAFDRMNVAETVDMHNPKEKFIFILNQNYSYFGITESQFDKIKSDVISKFKENEFQNYNAKAILMGYKLYKEKVNSQSSFKNVFTEYKETFGGSEFDAIRYLRLWKLYLSKNK